MSNHVIKFIIYQYINSGIGCNLSDVFLHIIPKIENATSIKTLFSKNLEYQLQLIDIISLSTEEKQKIITEKIIELIHEKLIISIYYKVPTSKYTTRMLLLPKNTNISIGTAI